MQIEMNIELLRNKKLFLATPMYGGMCSGVYTKSLSDFMVLCTKYQIECKLFFIFNESLITRARNYLADEFIRSGYDHLIFIDSDIHFEAQDVLLLSHYAATEPEMEIVCGPYPKKAISWEKIKLAVDKGYADKDPNSLENFVGDYVFNPADGITSFRIDEPVEVKEGGTGFMLVTRTAFDKFAEKYPQQSYKPDHVRTKAFDGSREIMAYFDCVIDPKTKRYLSEDYMFCQWAREAGVKVFMLPWLNLKHAGTYIFGGSLQALATIGASPTADTSVPKK
tara:strand:- start:58560 stop:59399 length:840 start_codon:yes stop_codon:yes gene_type:complete